MKSADHCWNGITVNGLIIITRPIQVGRQQADLIKAVLAAQRLAQLDMRDLGDRIPLIGGFQRSGEQASSRMGCSANFG
jgi:hypothetical protein